MSNTYSERWFSTFLATVPVERTQTEIEFLSRHLPLSEYGRVLDLACGPGRHAHALGELGYAVTGVDLHRPSLDAARRRADEDGGGKVEFLEVDMRDLSPVAHRGDGYDAAICMWQSFGHFDSATNGAVLGEVHRCLRPRGRFVLDLYNRRFFEPRQGVRRSERNGIELEERKEVRGGRLSVQIRYGASEAVDRFEWEVYTPEEIISLAGRAGFEHVRSCRDFDETREVRDDGPRMQLIFDRVP